MRKLLHSFPAILVYIVSIVIVSYGFPSLHFHEQSVSARHLVYYGSCE